MTTQSNAQELQRKISGYLESLMLDTDKARKSETMRKYLEFAAKFHNYSACNIMLILLAKPDATHVAGYESWKKMGRFVKRGEKGIPILAPMLVKKDPELDDSPKQLHGFRVVYVFDVAQTDGYPLPDIPDWKSPEKNAVLNERLIKFATSLGIKVEFKKLSGEVQGISYGGFIEIDPSAGTKTILHELGHTLLGHHQEKIQTDVAIKELEAESVAYVVAKHYGITGLCSPNYLALYGLTSKTIIEANERIVNCSSMIIEAVNSM